jgi:hypothetical protein
MWVVTSSRNYHSAITQWANATDKHPQHCTQTPFSTQRPYPTYKHPLLRTQTPLIKLAGLDQGQHTIPRFLFHGSAVQPRDVFHSGIEADDCGKPFPFDDKQAVRQAVFQSTGLPSPTMTMSPAMQNLMPNEGMIMADRMGMPWYGCHFVPTSQSYLIAQEFAVLANEREAYVYEVDARTLIALTEIVVHVNKDAGSLYPREHEISVGDKVPREAIKCAWKVAFFHSQVQISHEPIPNPDYKRDDQELEL